MKRHLYLTLILSFFTLFAFSQSQRMVLLEHFTQASCGPCATFNPQINSLLLANPNKITAIMYHTSWPGYDPMYNHNTTENGARTSFYNVSSVPNSVVDGNIYNGHPNGWNINTVNDRYAIPSPCEISIYHELSTAHDIFYAYVMIEASQDIPAGMKMHMAVIEEYIEFASPPGSNGEKDFYNVMKKMLPNQSGTVLPALQAGEYIMLEYAWEHQNVYDVDELAAVGFIQDNDTKEVMQAAASSDIAFTPPYITDADIAEVFNVSQGFCIGHVEPMVTIRNNGSNPLTSMDISYSINGSTPQMYNWSGNLDFLESETIQLSGSDFTVMAVNNLEVSLLNPNGGSDDYAANNTRLMEIAQAPSVTSPVTLILKLDNHPEETSWEVVDSEGTVLYEGGSYTTAGQIIVEQFEVEAEDCYTFFIYDDGGDGLTEGGSYKMGYNGSVIFAQGTSFGTKDEAQFSIDYTGVSTPLSAAEIELFPQPANDWLSLKLTLSNACELSYSVIDPSGKTVMHVNEGLQEQGVHSFELNLSALKAGIYYLSLQAGSKHYAKKIVLINQ